MTFVAIGTLRVNFFFSHCIFSTLWYGLFGIFFLISLGHYHFVNKLTFITAV